MRISRPFHRKIPSKTIRLLCAVLLIGHSPATDIELKSPDGGIQAIITDEGGLFYRVSVDGKPALVDSPLGLVINGNPHPGKNCELGKVTRSTSDTTWNNRFGKCAVVRDHYNEAVIEIAGGAGDASGLTLHFRAYDDGIAFAYGLTERSEKQSVTITADNTAFLFSGTHRSWIGARPSFESTFPESKLGELPPGKKSLPLVVETPAAFVAVAEADVLDWSGSFLIPVNGQHPGVRCELIAPVKTTLPCRSPWHVLIIGRNAGDLTITNLLENLATPSRLPDDSWIKPGCMAWDPWWTGENDYWEKFKGLGARGDTRSDIDYIDFAASMGWPYMLVDWYWYDKNSKDPEAAVKAQPHIDLPALFTHAEKKGVKLFLWVHSKNIPAIGADKLFATYAEWGAVGVKIDFFDHNGSQATLRWQKELLECAARHKLMLNFHGTYTPTGLSRTWPNLVSQEAVLGLEYNKMGALCDPKHMITLPFTRGLLGQADTTPGGFVNSSVADFKKNSVPCMVMGSRARHLAFSVMMSSPVLCLCDSPRNYRGQPGIEFFRDLPTVWDETRVLSAEMATHLVQARRSGDCWFLSAMNSDEPLNLKLPLSMLGGGSFTARVYEDTPATAATPTTIREHSVVVTAKDHIDIHMTGAGGFVAVIGPR